MKDKATFAILGFMAGLGTYWGFQELKPDPNDPLAAFVMPYDPTAEFNRLQERLFANAPLIETVSSQATLEVEEDDSSIYYEIKIPDLQAKDVEVRIDDGLVVIQGKSEKSAESLGQHSYFASSFHQSFPLPVGVPADLDATKVKIEYEDDRVRIVFPKERNSATAEYT